MVRRAARAVWLVMALGVAAAQEPAAPPATPEPAPRPETTPPTWPPAPGGGEYYGQSLPGWFGGQPYREVPFAGPGPEQPSGLFRPTRQRQNLSFSGFADVGLTLKSVTGATQTFSQDQYGRDQLFSQNASLLVTGPIWKALNLNVHAQIEQRSFGFNDTRPVWRVFWEDQNTRVTFGDVQPRMGDTNEFVPFSRRLTGLQAEGKFGKRLEYMAFGSQVGGSIRNETIVGNGTPGPYFLTFVPIVDGSAVVVLDGVIQQPGYGDTGDYTLNPSTGELNFNGTRIIAPTSRIEVRYETLGSGGPKDLLLGAQLRYALSSRLRLGVQYITQLAGSSGGPSGPVERRVTDQLIVPTPSTGPFTIRPRPIVPGSESVQVNGILQVRDVDYEIAYETGELRFFQIQPEGANIVVHFSVIESVDLGSGDRGILGLDGSWTVGQHLNLQFEFARSSGDPGSRSNPYSFSGSGLGGYGGGYGSGLTSGFGTNSGNYGYGTSGLGSGLGGYNSTSPFGGTSYGGAGYGGVFRGRSRAADLAGWALAAAVVDRSRQTQFPRGGGGEAYKLSFTSLLGDFQLGGQLKSVGDNFSRIDSTGFFQNEKGLALQAQYNPGSRLSISQQFDTYSRPTAVDESGVSTGRVRSSLWLTSVNWRFLPGSSLNLMQDQQSNSGGGSSNSLSRTSLTMNHQFSSQLQLNAGLERARSGTSGLVGTTSQSVSNDSTTTSYRTGLSYNSRGGKFGARIDYNFSGTTSSSVKNSATSILGSLNYQPFEFLGLQFSHQLSDSRNESLVAGRVWTRVPRPGTVAALLYALDLANRRQAGVGAFDETGQGDLATDPLTGAVLGTNLVQNNKTQNTSLGLNLTPGRRLSFTNTVTHTVTDNGRLAGSTSDSLQSNLHYQLSDALGFGLGYSLQGLHYADTGDRTTTRILNLNADWQLSNHLGLRFDYQSQRTGNSFGPRDETDATAATTGLEAGSKYGSWGLDMRWTLPGSAHHTLFATIRRDRNSSGSANSFSRNQFQTGMDFKLTSILGLRVSYDLTNYSSQNATSGSYTAHLFNTGLGVRF